MNRRAIRDNSGANPQDIQGAADPTVTSENSGRKRRPLAASQNDTTLGGKQ